MIWVILAASAFFLWDVLVNEPKRGGRLTLREVAGVTKWLMLGPGETPKCRVCEIECPDPMLREDIGYGAVLCMDCEEEVRLEAGLIRPDWFDQPLPPEGPEVPELAALKVALDAKKKAPPRPPGPEFEVEHDWSKKTSKHMPCSVCFEDHDYGTPHRAALSGAALAFSPIEPQWVAEWRAKFLAEDDKKPIEVWRSRPSGELYAPSPRMNCPIKNCGDPACKLPPSVPRQILD